MSDGSGDVAREQARASTEKLLAQRERARKERDRLYQTLDALVRLHDGIRDDAYHAGKHGAWRAARAALRQH